MTDLTGDLLPRLSQYRLPGLDLGEGLLYPNYDGYSILNLPDSLCHWLGVPPLGVGRLADEVLSPLGEGYRRVILILMDALALHRLQRWMAQGQAPLWAQLAQQGLFAPLTSITPSTTSAALTTLWTGHSPSEHAITGYEMWMKEYGMVVNTITHAPMSFQDSAGSLSQAGFTPEGFLPLPTLGAHLFAHGVKTYAFQHHSLLQSGLSKMFFKQVEPRAFLSAADLFINLRELLEKSAGERQYIYVYWSGVDTFSHRYGPDDERPFAEFTAFSRDLQRLLLERLPAEAKGETLLALVADHGQIATRPDPHYDLSNHPGLTRRLHLLPTGENRLAYLYVRPGQSEAVREYLERAWPNQFALVDSVYAAEAGLFGPGERHPRLLERVGDFILAARGPAYLWWDGKENRLHGRHGGLDPEEMLVPFLAAPL